MAFRTLWKSFGCKSCFWYWGLTLSRRRSISYRNQSIDLRSKSMDWFLYDIDLRRERVKLVRSSRWGMFFKKYILKIWKNSQENTTIGVSFLIKLQASSCNFIKKSLWHRCFLLKFANFLRTLFLKNISGCYFWLTVFQIFIWFLKF